MKNKKKQDVGAASDPKMTHGHLVHGINRIIGPMLNKPNERRMKELVRISPVKNGSDLLFLWSFNLFGYLFSCICHNEIWCDLECANKYYLIIDPISVSILPPF